LKEEEDDGNLLLFYFGCITTKKLTEIAIAFLFGGVVANKVIMTYCRHLLCFFLLG